ncbi:MAG TPA: hypothetical protein VII72_08720 [Myxococcota bacterium]|jgi:hypothetical protein
MKRWNADLERREAVRKPTQALPCVVWVGSDRYEGVLEQVSAQAVVVRMEAVLPDSQEARLTFSTRNGASFVLRAVPVRGHLVPHTLRGLLPPSVVLRLRETTAAYLRWVFSPTLGAS